MSYVPDLQYGSNLSAERRVSDVVVKPAFSAASAALLTKLFFPNLSVLNVGSTKMSLMMAVAVAMYGASVAGTLFTDFALPQIARKDQIYKPSSFVTNVGVGAAAEIGGVYVFNPSAPGQLGIIKLGVMGALAETVGSLIYYNVFAPAFYKDM